MATTCSFWGMKLENTWNSYSSASHKMYTHTDLPASPILERSWNRLNRKYIYISEYLYVYMFMQVFFLFLSNRLQRFSVSLSFEVNFWMLVLQTSLHSLTSYEQTVLIEGKKLSLLIFATAMYINLLSSFSWYAFNFALAGFCALMCQSCVPKRRASCWVLSLKSVLIMQLRML